MSVFLCSITAIIIAMALVSLSIKEVRKNIAEEVAILETVIGKRSKTAFIYMQYNKVEENLQDLQALDYVELGCAYDKNLSLIASYRRDAAIECSPYIHISYSTMSLPVFGDNSIEMIQPINIPEGPVGYLYIKGNLSKLSNSIHKIILNAFFMAFIAIFIAYLLSNHIQKLITIPLIRLEEFARKVTHGNYSLYLPKLYNDEIGSLTAEFNMMLNNIKERDQKLKDINETLEQKVLERTRDLEIAKVKAESANDAKSEFLRNMSHEFRTPLHGIQNFSFFGMSDADTKDREVLKNYFARIHKVSDRLTCLTEGILNLSQMESGAIEFSMAKCNLVEVFDVATAEQEATMQEKGINFVFNKPDYPIELVCCRAKIIQVAANLVGNAVKFSSPGKEITITMSREEGANPLIRVAVKDQGIGIPEDELGAIFKKFIQSTRTKTNAGGTGLGLAICNGIIMGHGGRIWAENNKDGEGSTFIFTLPLDVKEGTRVVKVDDL